MCWGSGIGALCDLCLLRTPTVYLFWAGGERRPRHIEIPIPVLGSLKCGVICKNQELTEYVGGLVNIISYAYLTSISEI